MKNKFAKCCHIGAFVFVWAAIVLAGEKADPNSMVAIPAGIIRWFGTNINVPQFYIDQYETIQQAYEKTTGENLSYFKGSHKPVEKVNWFEADKYCKSIGKRLPTEWEWERAAKLGE